MQSSTSIGSPRKWQWQPSLIEGGQYEQICAVMRAWPQQSPTPGCGQETTGWHMWSGAEQCFLRGRNVVQKLEEGRARSFIQQCKGCSGNLGKKWQAAFLHLGYYPLAYCESDFLCDLIRLVIFEDIQVTLFLLLFCVVFFFFYLWEHSEVCVTSTWRFYMITVHWFSVRL